ARPALERVEQTLTLRFPFGSEVATFAVTVRSPRLRVLFVGNERFFARPALYGDERGDYPDNHLRFAFFTLASLSAMSILQFDPDVVHCNDWQTGLGPVALRRGYRGSPLGEARTLFTIHNLAYQGIFPKRAMDELGLPWELFVPTGLEFYDQLNFMKAGIAYGHALTTVSPRYAREIQTPEAGWGLDGMLRLRNHDLYGILNGVDTHEWDPSKDHHLPFHFDASDLSGKAKCKAKLLEHFHLSPGEGERGPPLFGIVSRLVSQKGFDILLPALSWLLEQEVRFVALGSGDPRYEQGLRALQRGFPDKVGLMIGYDVDLSHLIEAGSDFFLMPSLYEPCGLNQMYSLLYGTVPIVRAVGGLDDTVIDVDEPGGNGIKLGPFDPGALVAAMRRALALYADPARFEAVRIRGMRSDFSWSRSARQYEAVYRGLPPGDDLPKQGKAQ
ncbi:MAG TPA: glycogen/starch synthase, partial [Myxococcaceae bacterium]|nr:glycogen/starch synthase [Myxococcaceae bacterium]